MSADEQAKKLSQQEVDAALQELPGWSLEDGMLHKTFEFKNFSEAFAWMTRVAIEAEKLDHHPDWCNAWNKVHVHLVTHAADGLTHFDVDLAQKMEALAA